MGIRSSLAKNLIRFNELGQLPIQLERLDEGNGIEMAIVANNAKYHQSCKLQYKAVMSREKAQKVDREDYDAYTACKYRKSRNTDNSVF